VGFSPQKPARRAFERNPELVGRWLDERYPELERRAYRERALILSADEMGLRSDHSAGRSWSPVGQTPIVAGTGQRFGANVISAISNKGRLQFSVFTQRFTAAILIDFLTRLIRQADGQKIILILDGHPVHRANKVREWVAVHAERIELQFLPGYSNPRDDLGIDLSNDGVHVGHATTLRRAGTRLALRMTVGGRRCASLRDTWFAPRPVSVERRELRYLPRPASLRALRLGLLVFPGCK
jgi:hypothetical protein